MNYRLFLICFFSFFAIYAQTNAVQDTTAVDNSIKGQFENLYKNSNNYQEYKVVKRTWIQNLKNNTTDSINVLKNNITTNNNLINKQKSTIDELNQSLTILNTELAKVSEEKDEISFFGIALTKGGYKTLMWSIVIGLLGLLIFFIYKYQSSQKGTKEAVTNLQELERDFEEHRRRALEREQVVMRKLQDEINKHKS